MTKILQRMTCGCATLILVAIMPATAFGQSFAGTWKMVENVDATACEEGTYQDSYTATVTQSGSTMTVSAEGITRSGTLSGNRLSFTANYPQDGGTISTTGSITFGSGTASGSSSWVWSGGGISCSGTSTLSATQVTGGSDDGGDSNEPPTPTTMTYSVSGTTLTISWSAVAGATSYRLFYAPYPAADPIYVEEMGSNLSISGELPVGSSYYIAVEAYNDAGPGGISNIANFTIDGSDTEETGDTTPIQLIAPPPGDSGSASMRTGQFFDMLPLIVWQDSNPDAVSWQLVAGNSRLPVKLKRGSDCTVNSRCATYVAGVWDALGVSGGTAFVRLEGLDSKGTVVSKSTFDFTQNFTNSIVLEAKNKTQFFAVTGHGSSPAGQSSLNKYPNTQTVYCSEEEMTGCLSAYIQPASEDRTVLVVERRPSGAANGSFSETTTSRIWLPNKFLDSAEVTDPTKVVTVPWSCRREGDVEGVYIDFQWLNNGQLSKATGNQWNEGGLSCSGSMSLHYENYEDVRGTWRLFSLSGSGSLVVLPTGSEDDKEIHDINFSVQAAVKWEDGEIEPTVFWSY